MQLRSREALVKCLEGQGISERELARRAELGHATVNHLITGRRTTCSLTTAVAIERGLSVGLGVLFTAQSASERSVLRDASRLMAVSG